MPELPEVEVTRRRIAARLVGRRIAGVRTSPASYVFLTPPTLLKRRLRGRAVVEIERRGKYLLARLDDKSSLVLHLGMTGQLFSGDVPSLRLLSATAAAALPPKAQRHFRPDTHTHLQLVFQDAGPRVYFRDVRRFGKLLWLAPGESHERLERLGVDALVLRGKDLFAATRGRHTSIKALLLDQAVVAGVGNIYADEALHLARVRPSRSAARVTKQECAALVGALRHVLKRSIATGGSSISDFIAPDGRRGRYQRGRLVYARAGEACATCRTPIRRAVVAQRGTHFCPACQR